MWSLINVSSNLRTTDVKLTGLYFSGLFLDPFLNMFGSFHFASGVLICSTIYLGSFGGIPSTPGDLLSFIFLIFFGYHFRSYN